MKDRLSDLELLDRAADVVLVVGLEPRSIGAVLHANRTAGTRLGHAPEALTGLSFAELIVDPGDLMAEWASQLRSHGRAQFECSFRLTTGIGVPVEIQATTLDADRERALLIAREIGGRRQLEQANRAQVEFLRDVLDGAAALLVVLDPSGRIIELNRGAQELLPGDAAALLGERFWDAPWWEGSTEARFRIRETVSAAVAGKSIRYDEDFRVGEGEIRTLDFALVPVFDDGAVEVLHIVGCGVDITDKRRMAWANEGGTRLRAFRSDSLATGHVDKEGRWIRVSQKLVEMIELDRKELLQITLWDVTHPQDRSSARDCFDSLLRGNFPIYSTEQRLLTQGGGEPWVKLTASPSYGEGGELQHVMLILEDVSDRKEQERGAIAVETARRVKQSLLANVSHELRTPMNAIIGMTELAFEETISSEARRYLSAALSSARQLMRLLNDLLDFSKVDAGKFELAVLTFDVRSVFAASMRAFGVQAGGKGIEFAYRIADDVPDHLSGDPDRVRQIVANLVSNALKFTVEGKISVDMDVESRSEASVTLLICVSDTGVGIADEDQRKIFAPFSQADSSFQRRFGGTGLGLAIARELTALMGGRIELESRLGEGSTFRVWLVLGAVLETPGTVAAPTLARELHGLRALVVDDNATNRLLLLELVSALEVDVGICASGAQALVALREAVAEGHPYDVLLTDVLMPGMDGFALVEAIEADAAISDLAIILVTSADRRFLGGRDEAPSIHGVLEKPVSLTDVRRALLHVVAADEAPRRARRSRNRIRPLTPLSILAAEDTPANQLLVQALLERRGHDVEIAANGRVAVERFDPGRFDVILMDVQMPTMDGFAATKAIRARELELGCEAVPIIAMTAHAMAGDRDECLAAGMSAYIAKPIDARELVELVERSAAKVASAEPEPETETSTSLPNPSPVEASVGDDAECELDHVAARSRLGDEELYRDMIAFFLEDAPDLVDAILAGVDEDDAGAASRGAHTLKGLSGSVGAETVRRLATELERECAAGAPRCRALADDLRRAVEACSRALTAYLEPGR